jgi:very-short-patch-repair endonuclease
LFDQTIRRMLSLFPRGATNDQLIWRLSAAGIRVSPSELLAGLGALAQRGEIVRDAFGRWRASAPLPTRNQSEPGSDARPDGHSPHGDPCFLYAVDATCRLADRATPAAGKTEEGAATSLPGWAPLIGYYAATQRKDPRGQIEEFSDRHGSVWQLIRTSGSWWSDASVRIGMEVLQEPFREALLRRAITSAAIGWPVSLFKTQAGDSFIPGLIIPVDLRIEGADLVLEVEAAEPAINPAWSREVRKRTAWSDVVLTERLFPEGEDNSLGAVSERMRHALATIGGAALRPADLASEISISGTGLRNAAALFLPEDGTFTKATAEDLEAIREWSAEQRTNTALDALLGAETANSVTDIPVLQPGPGGALTDSQLNAAEIALAGPLTVIQGPPGTGKSQVILSLIVSAVMSGKTVLFSAKNHQAVDEVERRLQDIVPDAPLLTRARDAEGERNVSFLDALADIAHAQASAAGLDDIETDRSAILGRGGEHQDRQRRSREEIAQHLALSELAERYDALRRVPRNKARRLSIPDWFKRLFERLFYRGVERTEQPLPENASIVEIERRMAVLRRRLETASTASSNQPVTEADRATLAQDVARFLLKLASHVTRPSETERHRLSERASELEFSRVRARRMPPDDARAVLRHRPVWAVSTLSAPARIPLIPGLFDYVIFDEASQCDIASALPLLARAGTAVVVGDPMQLNFVPPLGNAAEHALMDAAGLPKAGRAAFAQSINSLFDFCERRPAARRMFLADQFRSAPAIVDYLNADFYMGRLVDRRSEESFRPPGDYRPGLAWEDVCGHATRNEGGTINPLECERVAALLKRMASDPDFSGTVGVISPFNAQVTELQRVVHQKLPDAERDRLSLRISTIDKFQGGEADVILFSLVLDASAPRSSWTFLRKERRRLNVAVSRARALCVIVGDLTYAKSCGIRHIEFLADRASKPWTPQQPKAFDSGWERRLDAAMRARGLQPFPQFPVGRRYLDFALDPHGVKLDVEVDGRRWHTDAAGNRKVADRLRDAEMRSRGWKVLRFWVHQLADDMEGCLDRIERELGRR